MANLKFLASIFYDEVNFDNKKINEESKFNIREII